MHNYNEQFLISYKIFQISKNYMWFGIGTIRHFKITQQNPVTAELKEQLSPKGKLACINKVL